MGQMVLLGPVFNSTRGDVEEVDYLQLMSQASSYSSLCSLFECRMIYDCIMPDGMLELICT